MASSGVLVKEGVERIGSDGDTLKKCLGKSRKPRMDYPGALTTRSLRVKCTRILFHMDNQQHVSVALTTTISVSQRTLIKYTTGENI